MFVSSIRLPIIYLTALTCALSARAEPNSAAHIKLNQAAFESAIQLIERGRFILDSRTRWHADKPSTAEENNFIQRYGLKEYAKWHLGIDDRYGEGTKARSKFPFGDFNSVHRCGLLAVKSRARQFNYTEIAEAATRLESAMASQSANQTRPTKKHR